MSSTSVSPAAAYTSPQPRPPLPTLSPFSFSAASTRWSSRNPTQTANLSLRFLALVLSFAAALSLAAISPTTTKFKKHSNSFCDYPELVYCFTVNILAFLYAAYQLFKSICDIAHRGVFISDMVSDYISFIFDQLAGYLVVSASSVAVPVIQHMYNGTSLRKAATVSVCMSFASFLVIAASGVLSGYRLCRTLSTKFLSPREMVKDINVRNDSFYLVQVSRSTNPDYVATIHCKVRTVAPLLLL
ncbi:CASP-like protein 4A4 [Sesamum angolense]|uniref:CASP-like protein n=1 Tax=Sesamum angolense TaxID=2727404 RepID=A0AAE1W9N2_9LAMI|nr:CASP-like protein 4A4 [Sesamum angolense]